MKTMMMRGLLAMSLPLVLVGGAVAAEKAGDRRKLDPGAMCAEMLRESSPEARQRMEEFMESDRAPQAMANMMEMARRMGNGDAMVGMTRMMEMMGSMNGGQGGMMQPGPGK
jgi:hypothetical protein